MIYGISMRKIRSGNKINSFSLETVWKKSWERARLIYKSILNKNEFDNEKKIDFMVAAPTLEHHDSCKAPAATSFFC